MITAAARDVEDLESYASEIIAAMSGKPLLEALRALHLAEGMLKDDSIRALAKERMISPTRLSAIAASYPEFSFEPDVQRIRPVSPHIRLPGFLAEAAGASFIVEAGPLTARFARPPQTIADYLAWAGLKGFKTAKEMGAHRAFSQVVLGGVTRKALEWQMVQTSGQEAFIVANAHAGDPSAGQAKLLMRNDPYGVIEGMYIAALITGSRRGFIFLDPGSKPDSARLSGVAAQMHKETGLDFTVEILAGPQTLVGSEDSVAVGAIERDRPMPFPKQVAKQGVEGRPTLIDSAECFAALAATFSFGGPVTSRIYQLGGPAGSTGIVEAEPNSPVSDILAKWQEGAFRGAVLAGGLSGKFICGSQLRLPLADFERTDSPRYRTICIFVSGAELNEAVAEMADYNGRHLCGYCIPCRIGSIRIAELLAASATALSEHEDGPLRDLAQAVERSGLCHPGRGAAEMVLSAMRAERFMNS